MFPHPRVASQRVRWKHKLREEDSQPLIHSPWPGEGGKSEVFCARSGEAAPPSTEQHGLRSSLAVYTRQWLDVRALKPNCPASKLVSMTYYLFEVGQGT